MPYQRYCNQNATEDTAATTSPCNDEKQTRHEVDENAIVRNGEHEARKKQQTNHEQRQEVTNETIEIQELKIRITYSA